jgi:hypothetical protein
MANLHTPKRNGHDDHSNVLSLGRCNWRGTKCDVVDVEGVFIARGQVIACDLREAMLDDDLGKDHVGILILYCLDDILTVMSIWRWLLSQTIIYGHSLKALLKSYYDNHIFDVDVEGAISVKKKQYTFHKKKVRLWRVNAH